MKNFDTFIGIDWSGAKGIYTPSIAVAKTTRDDDMLYLIKNATHKYWSRRDVFDYIGGLIGSDERILIGIDCNFGYCHTVGAKQCGTDYKAHDLWQAVEHASEDDNFYAGGFWSDYRYAPYFWTEGKQPAWFDTEKLQRQTEKTCIANGYGRPESPFKLFSAKQVGKGGMAGMRVANALKHTYGDTICMWPFEPKLVNTAQIVITEIFPRQFLKRFGFGNAKLRTLDDLNMVIKDRAIFKDTHTMTDHDTDALISAVGLKHLCGTDNTVPENVANPKDMKILHALCEGWIFGVGDQ